MPVFWLGIPRYSRISDTGIGTGIVGEFSPYIRAITSAVPLYLCMHRLLYLIPSADCGVCVLHVELFFLLADIQHTHIVRADH